MGPGDGGRGAPSSERRALKQALARAVRDPDSAVPVPLSYALDLLERRYGQPPGSAATWEPEVLLRSLAIMRIENSVRRPRG